MIVQDLTPGFAVHQIGRLLHRKLPAQRQTQRLEQQGKTAAFACPRHRQLRGLAAAAALHTRHVGVQPGFELEEIQVAPTPVHAVVDQLVFRSAHRASRPFVAVLDLEVDPSLAGVEFDVGDLPGGLQAKCSGEECFDLDVHGVKGQGHDPGVVPPGVMFVEVSFHWKRHWALLLQ